MIAVDTSPGCRFRATSLVRNGKIWIDSAENQDQQKNRDGSQWLGAGSGICRCDRPALDDCGSSEPVGGGRPAAVAAQPFLAVVRMDDRTHRIVIDQLDAVRRPFLRLVGCRRAALERSRRGWKNPGWTYHRAARPPSDNRRVRIHDFVSRDPGRQSSGGVFYVYGRKIDYNGRPVQSRPFRFPVPHRPRSGPWPRRANGRTIDAVMPFSGRPSRLGLPTTCKRKPFRSRLLLSRSTACKSQLALIETGRTACII